MTNAGKNILDDSLISPRTSVDYKTRRCYQDARIAKETSSPTSYFSWSMQFNLHTGIKSSHYVKTT